MTKQLKSEVSDRIKIFDFNFSLTYGNKRDDLSFEFSIGWFWIIVWIIVLILIFQWLF